MIADTKVIFQGSKLIVRAKESPTGELQLFVHKIITDPVDGVRECRPLGYMVGANYLVYKPE